MFALIAGAATAGLSLTAVAGTAGAANKPAAAKNHVVITVKTIKKDGKVLFDQQGLALYIDVLDKPPHFACTGGCLTFWPPVTLPKGQKAPSAGKGVTGLGSVKSPSGRQVTWRGMPLYTYAADKKGTVTGQGVKQWGTWWAADSKKAQAAIPKAIATGTNTSTSTKTKTKTAPSTTATTASSSWG